MTVWIPEPGWYYTHCSRLFVIDVINLVMLLLLIFQGKEPQWLDSDVSQQ